jgi:hypothetical protein
MRHEDRLKVIHRVADSAGQNKKRDEDKLV